MEGIMAQYAIVIYTENRSTESDPADVAADATADPTTDATNEERDVHSRYADQLIADGSMVAAFALHPAENTATSVRGDVITDGPFIDAKEVIAGFYVVEATDLDAALEIARRNPIGQQGGGVEVRPVEGAYLADHPGNG
jgi:hypothetical protein